MWPLIQAALAQSEATTPPAEAPPVEPTGVEPTGGDLGPKLSLPLDQMPPEVDPGPVSTADPTPIFRTSENLFEDTTRLVQEAAAISDHPEMLMAGQSTLGQLLELHLFTIGSVEFTPGRLLLTALTVLLTFTFSRLIRRATTRAFNMRGVTDQGRIGVTNRLVHYTVLLLGFSMSLEAMGIHLSALFAAGAIFAVGLGFALQDIVQNFVSGVILLIERSIKPIDVIEFEGEVVRVEQMGIRATVVRTQNEEEIIVPNGTLVGSAVKNYTKGDRDYRIRASVGVHYKSDMAQVEQALIKAAKAMPGPAHIKTPVALLVNFGDNSVNWELSLWTQSPWSQLVTRSQLNMLIWNIFKEEGIELAFPQLDLHLDQAVLDALRGSSKGALTSKK